MILDYAQLVKWRREFHRFPEEGWTEFWTTTRIADYLESMGFEILLGSQIIHRDFVRGRNNILVEKALARAKWNSTPVVLPFLIQDDRAKPWHYVLILTALM